MAKRRESGEKFSPSRDDRDLRAKRKQSIVKYFTERVLQNQNVALKLGEGNGSPRWLYPGGLGPRRVRAPQD